MLLSTIQIHTQGLYIHPYHPSTSPRHARIMHLSYYFRLRHWCIRLGVETPGLYEASPPRRRSESLKATEANAIAEAAAAASKAAATASEMVNGNGGGVRVTLREAAAAAAQEAATMDDIDDLDGGGAVAGKERDNLLQIGGAVNR